jgi:hypothetical protein
VVLEPSGPSKRSGLRELRAAREVERWWGPADGGWPLHVEQELTKLVVTIDGDIVG